MNQTYIHNGTRNFWGMLAVAALVSAFFPLQATAQTACSVGGLVDSDCDGFSDSQEAGGIILFNGTSLGPTNPNLKDLFIILVPAIPSNLPADPLAVLEKPLSNGGLGFTVHQITITQAGPNRQVTSASPQKAILITESVDLSGDVLGVSNLGGPNGIDGATVYTQRIINFVTGVYAAKSQVPQAGLSDDYIRHTIAHEAGHVLGLTAEYNSRFGGNHYKTGSNVVMEQSVVYTSKGSTINFNISDNFAQPDPQDSCLNRLDQIGICLNAQ